MTGGIQAQAKQAEQEERALIGRVTARLAQQAVEYRVDVVRSRLVGDRVDHSEVQLVLDDRAADGWTLNRCRDGRPWPRGGMSRAWPRPR